MFRLEVSVTPDELHDRLNAAKHQGVSLSDHLRIALGMHPFGDPPLFQVDPEPRARLQLVHDHRCPEQR
jgi:hypothetical protein